MPKKTSSAGPPAIPALAAATYVPQSASRSAAAELSSSDEEFLSGAMFEQLHAAERGKPAAGGGTVHMLAELQAEPEPESETKALDKMWSDMTAEEMRAVRRLGWTPDSWDAGDGSPFERLWAYMSAEEHDAAELVGFSEGDFVDPASV
jgi:D-serine deaminase-like pyridoxal phosphate-dependent protein